MSTDKEEFIDYYELLQVHPSASINIIKKAYKTLILETHPDIGGSEERTKLLNEAYKTLTDPIKRQEYDRKRALHYGTYIPFKGTTPLNQIVIVCPNCLTQNRVKDYESIKYAKCSICGYKFEQTKQTIYTSKKTSKLDTQILENNIKPKTLLTFTNVVFVMLLIIGFLTTVIIWKLYNLNLFNIINKPSQVSSSLPTLDLLKFKEIKELERKAFYYTNKRQYELAIKEWENVILYDKYNEQAYFNLGQLYLQQGNIDNAIKYLEIALNLNKTPNTTFLLGNAYYEAKNIEKAIFYFNQTIELNPYHTLSHYNLGIIYTKLNKIDLAIKFYKRALELSPNNIDVMVNLSILFAKRKDYDTALFLLKRAAELSPFDPDIHFNLGIIYQYQGLTEFAKNEFITSLEYLKNLPYSPEVENKIKTIEKILQKLK